jgi:hypothetical protein
MGVHPALSTIPLQPQLAWGQADVLIAQNTDDLDLIERGSSRPPVGREPFGERFG